MGVGRVLVYRLLQGILGDHFEVLIADGLADGVGRGVDRHLQLLLPELGLALLNFIVKLVSLVA